MLVCESVHLTKITIGLSLTLALAWAPAWAGNTKDGGNESLAGPVSLHRARGAGSSNIASSNGNNSSNSLSTVPSELRALWQEPSREFRSAVALIGLEAADQSAAKLKAFVGGGNFIAGFAGLSGNKNNTEKSAAAYALAKLLAKSSDPEQQKQAIDLFKQAQVISCLRLAAMWHQSEIIAGQGDEKRIQEILTAISKDPQAQSDDIARAQYELAQSNLRLASAVGTSSGGNIYADKAQELLLDLKQRFPSSEFARGANYYLGQIALNPAEAQNYFRAYVKVSSGGRFSQDVADKLVDMDNHGLPMTADDANAVALVYFKKGDWGRALNLFNRTGNDLFRIAQCQARLKQKDQAVATLLKAVELNPNSTNYEDYVAVVTDPLSRAETREVWLKILGSANKPKRLDQALWNVATRSEDQDAIPLFARLFKEYPTSEYAPESMWWLFWHKTKKLYGQPYENKAQIVALADFANQAAKHFPRHRSAARFIFWSGKLHEKLKDHASAMKNYQLAASLYPTNYYGARARARLAYLEAPPGKKFDRGWSTHLIGTRQHVPQSWDWPGPEKLFQMDTVANAAGAKVAVLAVLRQLDEAIAALDAAKAVNGERLAAHKDSISGFKAWAYLSQAMPMEGIRAAGSDLEGNPKADTQREHLWQIDYPWAYCSTINEQAQLRKVDPYLAHALIREESRYFPAALSRSNAIGLMQLLPGTAYGVAKHIGLQLGSKEDIFIPENNIKLGTAYLAHTLERFNGNAMLAVASYNGGPNAVKHWVNQFQAKSAWGNDWDVFVEEIPYRETRDYVRKVFGSFFVYELLY